MKFFIDKYQNTQIWLETKKLRETKKQIAQNETGSNDLVKTSNPQAVVQAEVIFTQEDRGHNSEESQKIQQLYAKIKNIGFSPSYAGF